MDIRVAVVMGSTLAYIINNKNDNSHGYEKEDPCHKKKKLAKVELFCGKNVIDY